MLARSKIIGNSAQTAKEEQMKRFYLIIGLILFTTSVLFSGQTPVTSKFAIVDAGQGWQDSGIKLKKGQTYQIYAK